MKSSQIIWVGVGSVAIFIFFAGSSYMGLDILYPYLVVEWFTFPFAILSFGAGIFAYRKSETRKEKIFSVIFLVISLLFYIILFMKVALTPFNLTIL